MHERLPSLNIIRPVTNIGEADFAYLQRDLMMRNEQEEDAEAHIVRLFRQMGVLRATVISHGEIERLQRSFGSETLRTRPVSELAERIDEVLPDFSREALSVPTLPAKSGVAAKGKRRNTLTIAGSPEVLQERVLIKEVIRDFYNLTDIPYGVWLDDEYITRVRIARSKTVIGNRLINQMEAALQVGNTLLPKFTKLGPVEIRKVP